MKKMHSVLITGVAGFIGSNLANRLIQEGHSVIGIDDLSSGILEQVPKEVSFRKVDIRSKEIFPLFGGVDVVFHFAAKNCISECQLYPHETADVNILGTLNVFDAAREAKVGRVIYAESSAIYEGTKMLPTSETEFAPRTFYAITKGSDHLFAKEYEEVFGMKMVGLRYMNVYGPRQDYRRAVPPVMSAFIIKLLTGGKPVIFGDGTKRRDFVHVDDVNDFHLLCLDSDELLNRIFNIGSGENYSVLEIYEMIKNIIGSDINPDFTPDIQGEAQANLGDITGARSIGWQPKVILKDGLAGMVDFIRSEIAKGNVR